MCLTSKPHTITQCINKPQTKTKTPPKKVVGLPKHRVAVQARRAGGGFGAKLTRCFQNAAAAAVCARKLGRPVRVANDRTTDFVMVSAFWFSVYGVACGGLTAGGFRLTRSGGTHQIIQVGGREPLIVDYDVGFDDAGKVTAIAYNVYMEVHTCVGGWIVLACVCVGGWVQC